MPVYKFEHEAAARGRGWFINKSLYLLLTNGE